MKNTLPYTPKIDILQNEKISFDIKYLLFEWKK